MTQTPTFTTDDLKDALYAQFIDGSIERELTVNKSLTPYEAIFADESEDFHGSVKDTKEVWDEQYQDWAFIETAWDLNTSEDRQYFINQVVLPKVGAYWHGKEVLKDCKVIQSRRSVCLGGNAYDNMVKGQIVVSPAIRRFAGHIATSEAQRYFALALRKGGR